MNDDENEETEGQEFVDLNDLVILENENDPNYEPTEEEVIYYAEWLGFDVENDPEEFLAIAFQALKAPLPTNYRRAIIKNTNEMLFINLDDETLHVYSPIDELAIMHYREQKEIYEQKKKEEESSKAGNKVIPRKNLPPLGGGEGKEKKKKDLKELKEMKDIKNAKEAKLDKKSDKNLKEKNTKQDVYNIPTSFDTNVKNNKNKLKSKKEQNLSRSRESFDADEHNEKDASPQQKNLKFSNLNLNSNLNNISKDSKNNINTSLNKEETSNINKDKSFNKSFNKSINLNLSKSDHNNSIISNNDKAPIVIKMDDNNTSKNIAGKDLQKEKKEYLNKKLREIKDYETNLKEKFNKEKSSYKEKKNQLNIQVSDEFEQKLILNKRKIKDDNEKTNHKELEEYERDLSGKMDQELQNYQIQIDREMRENAEFQIQEILKEKNKMLEELDYYNKIIERNNQSVSNEQLNETKNLLEEKYLIEKKNLDRRAEQLEREIELDEEVKYSKDISTIQKQTNFSLELQEKALSGNVNRLLDDYLKVLEEDFNLQKNNSLKELEEKNKKDFMGHKQELIKQKEDKIHMYRKEVNELENMYYRELNHIREEMKQKTNELDKKLHQQFENCVGLFENLKKNVNYKIELQMEEINKYLSQNTENDNLSERFEEYILYILDDNTISCQRKKTSFEILESEYKDKSLFLEYFVEIGSFMIKLLKEDNISKVEYNDSLLARVVRLLDKEENISNKLMKTAREKHNDYKLKNQLLKDKKIFNFNNTTKNNFFNSNNLLISSNTGNNFNSPVLNTNRTVIIESPNQNMRYKDNEQLNETNMNSYDLLLTNDIINKIDDTNKNLIYLINDFLITEKNVLEKEEQDINKEKANLVSIKHAINNVENLSYTNAHLMSSFQILDEDREKFKSKENKFNSKKKIYDKIIIHIEEIFIYIKQNKTLLHERKDIINEKLGLVKNHIDEYNANFKFGFIGSLPCNPTKDIKIANSTDFFLSQKSFMKPSPETENINNTFTNFFSLYDKRTLHDNIRLPYTNEFFNYKRNKYELDSKMDVLKARMNNSNSRLFDS